MIISTNKQGERHTIPTLVFSRAYFESYFYRIIYLHTRARAQRERERERERERDFATSGGKSFRFKSNDLSFKQKTNYVKVDPHHLEYLNIKTQIKFRVCLVACKTLQNAKKICNFTSYNCLVTLQNFGFYNLLFTFATRVLPGFSFVETVPGF